MWRSSSKSQAAVRGHRREGSEVRERLGLPWAATGVQVPLLSSPSSVPSLPRRGLGERRQRRVAPAAQRQVGTRSRLPGWALSLGGWDLGNCSSGLLISTRQEASSGSAECSPGGRCSCSAACPQPGVCVCLSSPPCLPSCLCWQQPPSVPAQCASRQLSWQLCVFMFTFLGVFECLPAL